MFLSKTIAIVVPAYNEATQLEKTVRSLPDFVDYVIVVNDHSTDNTRQVAQALGAEETDCEAPVVQPLKATGTSCQKKVYLINHDKNRGCGASVASGYRWCRNNQIAVTATMDGDGQMDPHDLEQVLTPVVNGEADYCKGNRLFTEETYRLMPKLRFFGNNTLSFLTKIASGYWHIADSQNGFTAISLEALEKIPLHKLYRTYGYLNHLLVLLNTCNCRVVNVPVKTIYNQGEHSKLNILKAIPLISLLLVRLFFWRLHEKYIIRDFHPLIFFYLLSMLQCCLAIALGVRLIVLWYSMGHVPPMTSLAFGFCTTTGLQSGFFAMWFDMEYNKKLK